ncbi:phage tail protein, partial [Bisgaard Taxon 45]
ETRPKSLVLKLCIKAVNNFDDVVFWIKAYGEVVNTSVLDAGTLAQDLQQLRTKCQQIEETFNRNKTQTSSRIQVIEDKLNTKKENNIIWSGNVTQSNSNILQMSESIFGKILTFYMKVSSSSLINDSNSLHTCSIYIDKKIVSTKNGKKYIHGAAYVYNGWKNVQIELVSETQIIIYDISGMYLKQITAYEV